MFFCHCLDSKSESESDSSDEYVHPLLQAHRRPLKTQAETSADHGQKGNVDSSTFEQDVRNSSSILPHKLYANAAEVYMARKYEHLRKDRIKIGLETSDVTKNTDNDDWADHLEEGKNYSVIGIIDLICLVIIRLIDFVIYCIYDIC